MTSVLKQRFESSVNDGCRNFGTTVHEFVTVEDVRNVFQSMQSREEFDAFLFDEESRCQHFPLLCVVIQAKMSSLGPKETS